MAVGTNKEIFGKEDQKRVKPKTRQGGRPSVNEELVIRLLKETDSQGYPRYSYKQIARRVECSKKSVTRIRDRALIDGRLMTEERKEQALGMVEADFDQECVRAKGYSFNSWLSRLTAGKSIFKFCQRCWTEIWDKPNLVDASDDSHPLADQMAIQWLEIFGEDKKRIRNRKKLIRYIFVFLGRDDVNKRHLTMRKGADPIPIRRVAEIQLLDFPLKLTECIEEFESHFPGIGEFGIKFKLSTMMRTGNRKAEREFMGLRKGSEFQTFLLMSNEDVYRCHVYAKKGEEWEIIWLPETVRHELYRRYEKMETGDIVFKINIRRYRKVWGDITERIIGRRMTLHDLRKVTLTWFYCMDIPMEIAIKINVGWYDMNTACNVYLENRAMLKKTAKREYRDNIPAWFKEGLDEFTREESIEILQAKQVMTD